MNPASCRSGWRSLPCWLDSAWWACLAISVLLVQMHLARPGEPVPALVRELGPADRQACQIPAEGPVLLMFHQPACPCSRVTRENLASLADRFPGDLSVVLVELAGSKPRNQTAQATPGPEVGWKTVVDANGELARSFGIRTSGHILLFHQSGSLVFSGGITAGRGHEGEAVGLQKLAQQLASLNADRPESLLTHPVWGCELFSTADVPDQQERRP